MKQWFIAWYQDIAMVVSALLPLLMTTGLVWLLYLVLQ